MSHGLHTPVLLQEVIDLLSPKAGEVLLDGTIGEAGHSLELCRAALGKLDIIGIDLDEDTLAVARENLQKSECEAELIVENFSNLKKVLEHTGRQKVDMILLDLGMSSRSIEASGRGFSFQKDEPLIMTHSSDAILTAKDLVNLWDADQIEMVLKAYGNEQFARRIAEAIIEKRKIKKIETTTDLVEVIEEAVPGWYRKRRIHPATKTFQALRIAVNDEIGAVERAMIDGLGALNDNGRMAIITFHSLEDRFVKRQMKAWQKSGAAEILTKKPIVPSKEETKSNPRSRSAKLRAIKKLITNN
jgi:16S rRNA (cytosine1402-N4)-methyltransferase